MRPTDDDDPEDCSDIPATGFAVLLVFSVVLSVVGVDLHAEAGVDQGSKLQGIKGFGKLLEKNSPSAIVPTTMAAYSGRRVAIDANMALYQFLIAIRKRDGLLRSRTGEETSHLLGLFARTISLISQGISMVYVFDGSFEPLKLHALHERRRRRLSASVRLQEAERVASESSKRVRLLEGHHHLANGTEAGAESIQDFMRGFGYEKMNKSSLGVVDGIGADGVGRLEGRSGAEDMEEIIAVHPRELHFMRQTMVLKLRDVLPETQKKSDQELWSLILSCNMDLEQAANCLLDFPAVAGVIDSSSSVAVNDLPQSLGPKAEELNLFEDEDSEALRNEKEILERAERDKVKLQKQIVRVNRTHVDDSIRLLELMGVPVIRAPFDAEAQCAELAKRGVVYAAATEDLDALVAGAPRVLRGLVANPKQNPSSWVRENKKGRGKSSKMTEVVLSSVLKELNFTRQQLADVATLMGSDYSSGVSGVGPVSALRAIRKYGNLENYISALRESKNQGAGVGFGKAFDGGNLKRARDLILNPSVRTMESKSIKWRGHIDEEGLIRFLVDEKGFNRKRVSEGIERLKKARRSAVQTRLDSFFQIEEPV